MLYTEADPKTSKKELWVLPFEGDKRPFLFLRTDFNNGPGSFSPDGRWVAYVSDESGRNEIYVRPFPPSAGGKWLVSNSGGADPRWRGDGRELYYIEPDGKLMAVEATTSPTFQAGIPKPLFQAPPLILITPYYSMWDVTADGKRFLLPVPAAQAAQAPFTVVLNWQAALRK